MRAEIFSVAQEHAGTTCQLKGTKLRKRFAVVRPARLDLGRSSLCGEIRMDHVNLELPVVSGAALTHEVSSSHKPMEGWASIGLPGTWTALSYT